MDGAGGYLLLLKSSGNDETLRKQALRGLYQVVDTNWAEIVQSVFDIEAVLKMGYDQETSELAASIVSKSYFHLGDYNAALSYALQAGSNLDISSSAPFESTIVTKALDVFIKLKVGPIDSSAQEELEEIKGYFEDIELLKPIVDKLFDNCLRKGMYKEAVGIAIDAQEIGKLKNTLEVSENQRTMLLQYCLDCALDKAATAEFRDEILALLVDFYENDDSEAENFLELFVCLYVLKDFKRFAHKILVLLRDNSGNQRQCLIAYQAIFDVVDLKDQAFLQGFVASIKDYMKTTEFSSIGEDFSRRVGHALSIVDTKVAEKLKSFFLKEKRETDPAIFSAIKKLFPEGGYRARRGVSPAKSTLRNAALASYGLMQASTGVDTFLPSEMGKKFCAPVANWSRFSASALHGTIHLHQAAGSTKTLEKYLPLSGEEIKDTTNKGGDYAVGGALFALGLMNTSRAQSLASDYLYSIAIDTAPLVAAAQAKLENSNTGTVSEEAIAHGAFLGMGVINLGAGATTMTKQIGYSEFLTGSAGTSLGAVEKLPLIGFLMNSIKDDNVITSEAAANALGLLCVGRGGDVSVKQVIAELLGYIVDHSQHEKVIRAVSLAVAFCCLGLQEAAAGWIDIMLKHQDNWVRYGAMYAVGMAYVATSAKSAIQLLLRTAVSDVNDDVRRAAVTNIAFVCLNKPERVPQLVELLSQSYNSFVRYGAAMALGISSTAVKEEYSVKGDKVVPLGKLDPFHAILDKLLDDTTDFVKQGAMLGKAFALMQENTDFPVDSVSKEGKVEQKPKTNRAGRFRSRMLSELTKTNRDMVRLGAILSLGILESGGRNLSVKLSSHVSPTIPCLPAVSGMVLFLQYWYWFPLVHFLSLSFDATCLIGVTYAPELKTEEDSIDNAFKLVKDFSVEFDGSNELLKVFDYPKKIVDTKGKQREKPKTAVLSTTSKAKFKNNTQEGSDKEEKMEVDKKEKADAAEVKEEIMLKQGVTEERRAEILKNPVRVTRNQGKYIVFKDSVLAEGRFTPVARDMLHSRGVSVLEDLNPGEMLDAEAVMEYDEEATLLRKKREEDKQIAELARRAAEQMRKRREEERVVMQASPALVENETANSQPNNDGADEGKDSTADKTPDTETK